MVGPTIDDEDRQSLNLRLAVGFVVVVGLSGASTAVHAGGSLVAVALAGLASGLLGVLLVAYLKRLARQSRLR